MMRGGVVRRGRVNREYYRSETPAGSWDRQRGRPRQKGGKWKTSRSHTPQWETNEPTKQTPAKNQPTPAPATPTAKEAPTQPDQPTPEQSIKKPVPEAKVQEKETEEDQQLVSKLEELKNQRKNAFREQKKIQKLMTQNKKKRETISCTAETKAMMSHPGLPKKLSEVMDAINKNIDSVPLRRCTSPTEKEILQILPYKYSLRWDMVPRICQQRIQWLLRRGGVDTTDLEDIQIATAIRALRMEAIEKAKQGRQETPDPPKEQSNKEEHNEQMQIDKALEFTAEEQEEEEDSIDGKEDDEALDDAEALGKEDDTVGDEKEAEEEASTME